MEHPLSRTAQTERYGGYTIFLTWVDESIKRQWRAEILGHKFPLYDTTYDRALARAQGYIDHIIARTEVDPRFDPRTREGANPVRSKPKYKHPNTTREGRIERAVFILRNAPGAIGNKIAFLKSMNMPDEEITEALDIASGGAISKPYMNPADPYHGDTRGLWTLAGVGVTVGLLALLVYATKPKSTTP